jgi:hypothetical protein
MKLCVEEAMTEIKKIELSDEEKLSAMIGDMFETYIEGGFDFNTDQSLNDIFLMIFSDAVQMTLNVLEGDDEE